MNSQSPQMKAGSGLNSDSDLFVGDNAIQGQQVKAVNGFNSYSSGLSLNKDLFSVNIDFGAFTDPSSNQNKAENSNGLNLNSSVSTSNFSFMDPNFDGFISHSDPLGGDEFDGDDDGWEFKDAYSESKVGDANDKVNETMSENHKGALPLSIFGDDKLETDDSLKVQDVFAYKPSSYHGNGINSQGSNISIHDLLSNLYSQAEQIPCADNTAELIGNGLGSSVDQTSLCSLDDANEEFSTKLKLNNHLDFYCKLKDELSFVCRCHLYSLKKAQSAAALSGEDAKLETIEKEIQEACKELLNENINSKEYSEDQPPRDICLNGFLEVLHELKFGSTGSRISLIEEIAFKKDLKSAIDLMKHTTSTLNVLRLCSLEDQYIYVSTWSKMISVCAQELKHGSWIWKLIVEKNIQSWILSEPRGKHFIVALGEIYRVLLILGASMKLYKPWILSSSVDSTSIYVLLEECYTLWSSSGIKEALQGISDPIDFEYHSTVKALREYIHEHDELALGDHIFNQQISVCRLSLLTSEAVPAMKMVFWSGENYFLTLANLWANLISCYPPELPHLNVSS
ncbi:uncharacterized protein LOC130783211 isoform X3 [Actinidia eriantha]|uniref:uncharacterized protein LOC130783211 isoform X3 n=1 Tax=Actinidia eriantha TaxID=165200 RepID=UPI002583FC42|nr:uncharacterized protein LOC130783211 isoform X3 [Actinidia eriantha]